MATPKGAASKSAEPALLKQPRFRRYALAKFAQLAGQNALIYGLFIEYLAREGSLETSAFILAAVVPSIALSMPGGVFGDAVPKKPAILLVLLVRMAIVAAFLAFDPGLGLVLALTFALWAAYQFHTPPENVALLAVVGEDRVPAATSLVQAMSLAAQLAGAGLIAPVVLKVIGREGLFYSVEALLGASFVMYLLLPRLSPHAGVRRQRLPLWRALQRGMRTIRDNPSLERMTILRALLDTGLMMVMVAAPAFIEDSLRTGAENAVYVAVPGALGVALGLALTPALLLLFRPGLIVGFGYVCFVVTVLALAFVGAVSDELADLTSPVAQAADAVGLSREVFAAALLLPAGGFGASLVQVASRVAVLRSVDRREIAQVLAAQSAFGSLIALAPTFSAGVLFEAVAVDIGLLVVAGSLAVVAIATAASAGRAPGAVARHS